MGKRKMFIAEFMGAGGKVRFVGEGKLMPFDVQEARHFETAKEARAGLANIASHHKGGTYQNVKTKTVLANKPRFMVALGL